MGNLSQREARSYSRLCGGVLCCGAVCCDLLFWAAWICLYCIILFAVVLCCLALHCVAVCCVVSVVTLLCCSVSEDVVLHCNVNCIVYCCIVLLCYHVICVMCTYIMFVLIYSFERSDLSKKTYIQNPEVFFSIYKRRWIKIFSPQMYLN